MDSNVQNTTMGARLFHTIGVTRRSDHITSTHCHDQLRFMREWDAFSCFGLCSGLLMIRTDSPYMCHVTHIVCGDIRTWTTKDSITIRGEGDRDE